MQTQVLVVVGVGACAFVTLLKCVLLRFGFVRDDGNAIFIAIWILIATAATRKLTSSATEKALPQRRKLIPTRQQIADLVGIHNSGNSCFLNSSLQMLFSIQRIKECVESDLIDQPAGGLLASILQSMGNAAPPKKSELCELLRIVGLGDGKQHDACQFIHSLVNCLQTRSSTTGSLLQQEFSFDTQNTFVCLCCGFEVRSKDSSIDLILRLPPQEELKKSTQKLSIEGLIHRAFHPVAVDEMFCERCNKYVSGMHHTQITRPPHSLLLQIDRLQLCPLTSTETKRTDKLQTLSPTLQLFRAEKQYQLQSVVVHVGDKLDSGHYFAFCRHFSPVGGEYCWVRFDDERVNVVSFEDLVGECAQKENSPYLVVYSLVE